MFTTPLVRGTLITFYIMSIPLQLQIYDNSERIVDSIKTFNSRFPSSNKIEDFDFIIIGGGSSGSVLANRLSKSSKNRVLLLEEGGYLNPISLVPIITDSMLLTIADYQYTTVPQQSACLSLDGKCRIHAGKGLGGSSSINAMIYNRGNPRDYDRWAEITGDSRWSYENLLPYFKKSENYHGVYANNPGTSHSMSGELYVSRPFPEQAISQYFVAAAKEKGLERKDMNANQSEGVTEFDFTLKEGKRWGTYQAFVEPVLGRKNLKVYSYSKATKIHLDEKNRATRVTFTRHGRKLTVAASKEIIVSAGALNSPKLLMLSGIGPLRHLESVGIPCLVNLPVGQNLRDHVGLPEIGPISLKSSGLVFIPERDLTEYSIAQYSLKNKGPVGQHPSLFANGFLKSKEFNDGKWPDLEISALGPGLVSKSQTMSRGDRNDAKIKDFHYFEVVLTRPLTDSGTLRLAQHPTLMPLIDPKYFNNPSDIERLIDGEHNVCPQTSRVDRELGYKKLNATVDIQPHPKCQEFKFRSRKYWECHVKQESRSYNHYVGTCSMGKAEAGSKAVVDSQLRVIGTTGLRVVDCSVVPTIPNANTNAPAIMMGEIGSDLILRNWNNQYRVLSL